jgi:hypothetical protein
MYFYKRKFEFSRVIKKSGYHSEGDDAARPGLILILVLLQQLALLDELHAGGEGVPREGERGRVQRATAEYVTLRDQVRLQLHRVFKDLAVRARQTTRPGIATPLSISFGD